MLVGSSCDVPKDTPRHRVIHEKATQNKDENPREFQRTAVQLHRRLAKELLAEHILFTCDRPNLCTHLRMEQKSKLSHPMSCRTWCASQSLLTRRSATRICATNGREGMAKETYAYYANLLTHEADRFLRESRGLLVQDIMNLAKERGGEWNDMIFAQARGRSPDAPDACCLLPGLADFYVSAREWFRSIIGLDGATSSVRDLKPWTFMLTTRIHIIGDKEVEVVVLADPLTIMSRRSGS